MKYTNKLNEREGGEVHLNIYDSNDFDQIVDQINKNEEKIDKDTHTVLHSTNYKTKKEEDEGTKLIDKQKNHQRFHDQNYKKEKRKSISIDNISIFPYATSLVQTAESKESYVPSNSIKNAKLTKAKKNNTLKKFDDSYNIDTYEEITNSRINKTEKKHDKSKNKIEKEISKNKNIKNTPQRKGNENTESSYLNYSYKSGNPFNEKQINNIENKKKIEKEYMYEESDFDNDGISNEKQSYENGYRKNKKENKKQKNVSEFNKCNENNKNSDYSNLNSSINQRNVNQNKFNNVNPTKEYKNNIENEKEEHYLKNPFVLSIESLDDSEKECEEENKNININQMKTKVKEFKQNDQEEENDKNESEENKESTIGESFEPRQGTSYSIITDNQPSSQQKSSSRKSKQSVKGKEFIDENLKSHNTKSNATTTDSDYSFNEQMNISYENFKLYNKNKMYYIINQEKKKNELLDALNTEHTLRLRRILRIMREFYIGFIGIQLIYFITIVLMGMSNIYLIQIFSLSCTIFSILDANYHGYILNGFINFTISILFTLACTQVISGFEDLNTNETLRNIAISNVVLLYLFSILSFVNGFYIYKLHSTEKKCIKKVINTIEESTTQPPEKIIS